MRPDYSIYPLLPKDTAYGFLTRGCPNHCYWCVVPEKEGQIRPYMDIEDIISSDRRKAVLMDNNILAAGDYAIEQLYKIIDLGIHVDFNQAIDARLVNDENAKLLAQVKWINGYIRFGCDTPGQIKQCERAMDMIDSYGFHRKYLLYTMLNSNFHESYGRVHYWWEKNQKLQDQHMPCRYFPHAQPYRDPHAAGGGIPDWQKYLASWTNKRMLFKKFDFPEFEPKKGFKCEEFFKG